MSLDGFLRQQLGVDVVASAPFEGRVRRLRLTISEENPEPAGILGVKVMDF